METVNQLPAFESGKVVLRTGTVKALEVNLTSKCIDVNIEDKAFIKRAIALREDLSPSKPEEDTEPDINKPPANPLNMLRTVANALKQRGITVVVSYQGHPIVTIGAEAKPTLLQHITKTDAFAINSIYTAIKMVI